MEQKSKIEPDHIQITTRDGKPMKIPPEGALGLLALGYKGLIAWRHARRQYALQMKQEKPLLKNEGNSGAGDDTGKE